MANILTDILKPSVVTRIVSRIRTPGNVLSRFFGMEIGGKSVETLPAMVRQYSYDIFDVRRSIARARLLAAPAGTVAPQSVGNNTVTLARYAEKMPMDYNTIAAIRTLGENAGNIDRMGARYIEKQATELNRRQSNLREFLVGSLFRGGLHYLHQVGDDLLPSYTSTSAMVTVDLKIPSSHKLIGGSFGAGLAMETGSNTITATWATASNDIPLMLQAVSAGFQASVGEPLSHCFCGYKVWNNVLQNTYVRQLAGTSGSPFADFTLTTDKAEDGSRTGLQTGIIKGLPWIQWHIYDGGLLIPDNTGAESFTKIIPDDYVMFTIEPELGPSGWIKMVEGGEPVKINDLAPATPQFGFFSWMMEKADPARFELHTLQNVALELSVPKALAVARVQ